MLGIKWKVPFSHNFQIGWSATPERGGKFPPNPQQYEKNVNGHSFFSRFSHIVGGGGRISPPLGWKKRFHPIWKLWESDRHLTSQLWEIYPSPKLRENPPTQLENYEKVSISWNIDWAILHEMFRERKWSPPDSTIMRKWPPVWLQNYEQSYRSPN